MLYVIKFDNIEYTYSKIISDKFNEYFVDCRIVLIIPRFNYESGIADDIEFCGSLSYSVCLK